MNSISSNLLDIIGGHIMNNDMKLEIEWLENFRKIVYLMTNKYYL